MVTIGILVLKLLNNFITNVKSYESVISNQFTDRAIPQLFIPHDPLLLSIKFKQETLSSSKWPEQNRLLEKTQAPRLLGSTLPIKPQGKQLQQPVESRKLTGTDPEQWPSERSGSIRRVPTYSSESYHSRELSER